MLKKLLLVIFTAMLFFSSSCSSFVQKTYAQGTTTTDQADDFYKLWNHKWYSEMDYMAWYTKVYDPDTPESEIFGERYTAAQVQWVIYSVVSNLVLNFIPGTPDILICKDGDLNKCFDAFFKYFEALNLQANGVSDQQISLLNTIGKNPISGINYFKHVSSRFKIVPEAAAQNGGFGYNTAALSLIPIWSTVRNLSYGFVVIATMILAFMVMFQVKINPQTMITVQSSIPRVIGAAILITFSYAIAGFIIDLMYVFIGLIAMVISSSGLSQADSIQIFSSLTDKDLLLYSYLYWSIFSHTAFAISKNAGVYGIIIFIVALLAIFTVLSSSVKIIVMTIKNFALLVIAIITGPLEIMLGIITQSTGFGSWLKKIIGYSIFYPVLGLLYFLAFFFLFQGGSGLTVDSTTPFFPTPDFIPASSWSPPLTAINLGQSPILWVAISYVIFVEIPKVSEMIQSFISGKSWAFGSGINEVNSGLQSQWQKVAVDPLAKATPGLIKSGASWAFGRTVALATRLF